MHQHNQRRMADAHSHLAHREQRYSGADIGIARGNQGYRHIPDICAGGLNENQGSERRPHPRTSATRTAHITQVPVSAQSIAGAPCPAPTRLPGPSRRGRE